MAGKIIHPKESAQYVQGKNNVVTGITKAEILAVNWVDGDGKKNSCLVIQFGTDVEDKAPGVWILADAEQMGEQLKIANPTIKRGVRGWLAQLAGAQEGDVPETPGIDVGEMKGPAVVGDFDPTKVDVI